MPVTLPEAGTQGVVSLLPAGEPPTFLGLCPRAPAMCDMHTSLPLGGMAGTLGLVTQAPLLPEAPLLD